MLLIGCLAGQGSDNNLNLVSCECLLLYAVQTVWFCGDLLALLAINGVLAITMSL